MDETIQILRIGIDGRWEASEFGKAFTALDSLYTARFALALEYEELRELQALYLEPPFRFFPRSLKHLRRWSKLTTPVFLSMEELALAKRSKQEQRRLVGKVISHQAPLIQLAADNKIISVDIIEDGEDIH